jgi:predicted amidohydrolase
MWNSHIIIDNFGEVRAVYRKIHLFKVSIPNGPQLDESQTINAGIVRILVHSPLSHNVIDVSSGDGSL